MKKILQAIRYSDYGGQFVLGCLAIGASSLCLTVGGVLTSVGATAAAVVLLPAGVLLSTVGTGMAVRAGYKIMDENGAFDNLKEKTVNLANKLQERFGRRTGALVRRPGQEIRQGAQIDGTSPLAKASSRKAFNERTVAGAAGGKKAAPAPENKQGFRL